jgi:hypothetical protein
MKSERTYSSQEGKEKRRRFDIKEILNVPHASENESKQSLQNKNINVDVLAIKQVHGKRALSHLSLQNI